MKLEWFRDHQSKLWYVVAPLVILSMVVFLPSGAENATGSVEGPNGWMVGLDGTRHEYSPVKLLTTRRIISRFEDRGEVPTESALHHLTHLQIATEMGFEAGPKEVADSIRDFLKKKTQREQINPELYENFLKRHELTREQFEGFMRERVLIDKYFRLSVQVAISDPFLYVRYCAEKEKVRLLFKSIRSIDKVGAVEKPTDEDVSKYYEEQKGLEAGSPGALYTESKLAADVLFLEAKHVDEQIKPDDAELEKYYEKYRTIFWADAEKGGFKPFADVKADVLERYRRDKRSAKANELFEKWTKELDDELAKVKPEAGAFDWAAFAKARNLSYWRTKPQTQEAYRSGKDDVNAEDFKLALNLFRLAEPGPDEEMEKQRAEDRKKLQPPLRVHHFTDKEGFAALRLADFQPSRVQTLDEAKDEIVKRLIVNRSIDKAEEEAKALQQQWEAGTDLPKPEDLEDELCGPDSTNTLARRFRASPVPVGTILPVDQDNDAEAAKNDPKTRHMVFRVGYAAERFVPTLEAFDQDTTYNRSQQRQNIDYYQRYAQLEAAEKYLLKLGKPESPRGIKDPPLSGH